MSTEQQRKMMECAAKACGYEILDWYGERYTAHDGEKLIAFNPLTNPGDTAEMCAKLRISVLYEHDPCEFLSCFAHNSHDPEIAYYKDHDNSRLKAWMFAATMVAAKIGGMK